ncbi:ABC transporter related protein [Thioalkalivibrio nitratireducens DSM 14787]|uniref:ABC transporter related protein n=1 Tax=Thioalkalivibrio nitratireducens (strain DSM 14787 / UNIQEM 213 / ALEN2) TaxID=1255043 RepID=L0DT20_THIND|nr:ATP-binding cassette domain-containing protein [Thioalkalivibrio nitratireducens]AGA32142.1 ABC transporter related protein [Thioalkalivibrio nitratireducens DSM 14787]
MDCLLDMTDLRTAQLGPLDLRLQAGELVQITGASGSGKSLLLRALADLDPNQGQVRLQGQDRNGIAPTDWRRQVAYVPAETAWWAERVQEHFPSNWDRQQALDWLQRFSLPEEALDWEVERLSSGERQRLGLLRAFLNHPRVLLLDEPTANLDLENTRRIERAVRGYLAEEDAGALWVSHDTLQRNRLGGRILEIRSGRLVP